MGTVGGGYRPKFVGNENEVGNLVHQHLPEEAGGNVDRNGRLYQIVPVVSDGGETETSPRRKYEESLQVQCGCFGAPRNLRDNISNSTNDESSDHSGLKRF